MPRTARYTAVAVAGLLLDAVLVAIAVLWGAPLWVATLIGYGTALVATYLAHERWTMDRTHPAAGRFLVFLAIAAGVGIGRAVLAQALLWAGLGPVLSWTGAVGVSFLANAFLVLRLLPPRT